MPVKVLLVEDEGIIRLALRSDLEEFGYQVIAEASNGIEALERVKDYGPDVVIMDVKMPILDGLESARRISQTTPTPIVMLTAYSQDELVQKAASCGVMAYLVKPYRESELHTTIQIAIARFKEMMDLHKRVVSLEEMIETRKLVEKAKGVLMRTYGLSEEDAYLMIQKKSRDQNIPMQDIARALLLANDLSRESCARVQQRNHDVGVERANRRSRK